MKIKSSSIIIILLMLGILIAQIKVVPSWKNIQTILVISVFILVFVVGVIYLFKSWKQQKNKIKVILQMVLFLIIFFITLIFSARLPLIFKPEYIKNINLNNTTYYIYNESCFPPDGECECNYYGSLIYVKNKYLPIMHLLTKTDFYVGTIQVNNEELTVKSSGECVRDQYKTLKINL